jgi:superfamily I DNA/RNA helicase
MISPEDIRFTTDDVVVYLAAAGAGKTSAIMDEMTKLLETYRPDEIAFVTFTRKGVANGIERALRANPQLAADDLVHFKTLHALCFRELGLEHSSIITRADIREFNREFGFHLGLREPFEFQSDDDKLLARYDVLRSGSRKDVFKYENYDEKRFAGLVKAYKKFKADRSLADFHDCLLKFRERNMPVNVKVAFIDEAQDLTLLQWEVCRIAFSSAEKVRIAGDDFQCQPAGSAVLTDTGYKPIEAITGQDNLIVWDRSGQYFYGYKTRRYRAKVSCHRFNGLLVGVTHCGVTTKFTPNHRMIVRWGKRNTALRCVYLMRRGRDYRIGQCQVFNKAGTTHIAFRMRQEKADGIWVLYVSTDKVDVLVQEQVISASFGIPQLCFTFRQDVADSVFARIDTEAAAKKCLKEFSLDIKYPLLTDSRIRGQSGGTSIFECEAVNLIPEIMLLPVLDSGRRKTEWEGFHKSRSFYDGYVYGLSVDKYHTYVTDGIVTHNSLFTYAGASPRTLVSLARRYRAIKLETSYRLPRAVYRFAKGITGLIGDKIDKDFTPAKDVEGFVVEVADRNMLMRRIRKDMADNGTTPSRWYLLFRNNCFIDEVTGLLEQYTIPYHTARGFCIPEKDLVKIKRFYNYQKKGFGTKEAFEKFCKDHDIKDIGEDFTESNLIPSEKRHLYFAYVRAFDIDKLLKIADSAPFLLLSTTHRVKGGEADFVVVFLDCTRRVAINATRNRDEELRVLYVACTRAKTGLFLVSSREAYGFDNVVDAVKEQVP